MTAAANLGLLVFTPLVSKTGPLPEVLGAGSATPWRRTHSAKLATALLNTGGLAGDGSGRTPKPLAPHLRSACLMREALTPAGSLGALPAGPDGPEVPDPAIALRVACSEIPSLRRHASRAANRPAPCVVDAELVELVEELRFETFADLCEEPPQAARHTQAPSSGSETIAVRRLRPSMWSIPVILADLEVSSIWTARSPM